MVDTAVAFLVLFVVVESSVLCKSDSAIGVCVDEHAGLREDLVCGAVLAAVEVSGKDDGQALRTQLLNFLDDELRSFCPCCLPLVVEMEVEEEELLVGPFRQEAPPCAYSWARRVPSDAGLVWILSNPELPMLQQLQFLWVVEYGRIFPRLLAVVASASYEFISVEHGEHVVELVVLHLLRTEDVWVFEVDLCTDGPASLCPPVPFPCVVLVFVSDVVRGYVEMLCLDGAGTEHHDSRQNKTDNFHADGDYFANIMDFLE